MIDENKNKLTEQIKENEKIDMEDKNYQIEKHLKNQENIQNNEIEEDNKKEDELTIRKILNKFSNEIYFNYENIDSYKLKYIQSINKPYIIKGNQTLGDLNIFLNQKNQNGKKLDFCYLYGDKNNKTFIGFQIKNYDEEASHGTNFRETKESLKDSLKPILVNIEYLMGMVIKNWHYVLIISYNKRKPLGKRYFKNLVEKCNISGLEYLFFDFFDCVFYDRNFQIIKEYIPNDYSNLDNNLKDYLPINMIDDTFIISHQKIFLKENYKDIEIIRNGFMNLLNKKRFSFDNKIEINEIKDKLNKIIGDLKLKLLKQSIKFIGAYNYLDLPNIPYPKQNFIFLYPLIKNNNLREKEEIEDNYYFVLYRKDENTLLLYEYDLMKHKITLENKYEKFNFQYIDKNKKFFSFKCS